MSLLQDLLKQTSIDRRNGLRPLTRHRSPSPDSDGDSELIGVVTTPGTPRRIASRPSSISSSRASSQPPSPPSYNLPASTRSRGPHPLTGVSRVKSTSSTDPLKVLPTEINQRIFGLLTLRDLATCSRVNRKWKKSQTLNYVWFQQYRKENFQDTSLPPGKWTRRESKQDWRQIYMTSSRPSPPSSARFISLPASGIQTPRELREEQWRNEAAETASPKKGAAKVEMREMYKELGGRMARGKNRVKNGESRDRGGWNAGSDDWGGGGGFE
ncbi:hypothetical protein BOTBODRAFT_29794 [Botryobasidium botryosum FD-172 SS1]|uniref:F-box domain-containing protein n=1 Tax=Botryobasidium botryosum (strain FD-172 SS1) TaxID=930990 RepID=A0A067MPD1_BOTB1|nr:hypothetical protein BOTBODRAFT_29794 [Botryobasidium botryosum FD-172 SS1]